LLFATYGVGQGALLLAQTWLVVRGELAFIGLFGLSFTMATLAYLVVDWGGLVLLARQELSNAGERECAALFWNLTAARLILAVAMTIGFAFYLFLDGNNFVTAYALIAAPTLFLGAFNPVGLIDGLRRSGPNGIAAALPNIASALALVPLAGYDPALQGYILGGIFTLATLGGLVFQYAVLKGAHRQPAWVAPTARGAYAAVRDGGLVLLTIAPTQIFYRLELTASMSVLGPALTGLFVYVRQILGAALQCAQFIRRAEFPGLMAGLRDGFHLDSAIRAQKTSLGFTLAGSIGIAALGPLAYFLAPPDIGDNALIFALAYGVILILCGLYAGTTQVYIALGWVAAVAAVTNVAVVGVGLLIVPAVMWLGLYAFPVVDFGLNGLAFLGLLILLHRRRVPRWLSGNADAVSPVFGEDI
jgi:hypothetical protein